MSPQSSSQIKCTTILTKCCVLFRKVEPGKNEMEGLGGCSDRTLFARWKPRAPQGAPSRAGGPPVGTMLRSSLQKKGARARFCTGPLTDVQSGPPNDPSSPAHAEENADCVTGTRASMRSRSLPQRSSRMGTPGPPGEHATGTEAA